MRYWVTPFQLSATALSTLNEAGLQPWPAECWSVLSDAESLLLYDSPDRLIAMAGSGPETEGLTAHSLLQGYRRLLDWSKRPGQPLLAISQLHRLGPQVLRSWVDDGDGDDASPSPVSPLPIPPLLASVCISLLEEEPALLDCYHDLELRAVLLGRDPDLRYRERLLQAGQQGNALLQVFLASQRLQAASSELEKRLVSRDTELREVRMAYEQTLQELHQDHGALERSVQADAEKQRQLEAGVRQLEELQRSKAELESAHDLAKAAREREHDQDKAAQQRQHDQELEALRQRLEPRVADLELGLASRDAELREAREASEHTLRELHQVQGALERSVQADDEKQRQLEAAVRDLEELRRTKADLESAHDLAKAAQKREHQQELEGLRQQLEPRLAELEQRLASRDTELREAREASEMSLLQLHQVHEEREITLLADAEKQRQLEAAVRDLEELRRIKADLESAHDLAKAAQEREHQQELDALRQQLEPRLADLEQRLISRDTELREAREAAGLSLLQLHQVQEELEHYFLADAEKQRQLEAGVRDLEELRNSKADQESNYEQAKAAQQREHEQELEDLREQFKPRLAELEQRLISRETELSEAREIAEKSLLQLHQQVQEERERHSLAEGEMQRQLEAGVCDLEELRRLKTDQDSAHEQAKAELEQGLASMETELRQAREEAEMTFEQLHQAQEELEHYFLKARAGDQLAQSQMEQLQRAQSLMVRLNPDVLPKDPYPQALAVEVLSELPAAMPDPSLQTQALLSTYAASLQRASALLERARRS